MKQRRFMIMQIGYIGIGPASAGIGDTLCMIAGCNFPILLRRQSEYYRLVG
jgi:hypothetical protein